MTLYLDAIWLLNLLIDYMILRLTGYLIKRKNSGWRVVLSSFFASSIVFVSVFSPDSIILHPAGKIIFSLIIILIAFKYSSWVESIKTWLFFYFVSFALGGILIGLHYVFDQSVAIDHASVMTVSTGLGTLISWWFVVIGFPICWYFTKQVMDKQALVNYQIGQHYQCEIQMFEKTVSVQGYLDSANHLTDPITKHPVVIIDLNVISQFFSEDKLLQIKQVSESLDLTKIDPAIAQIVRLIPYQDVTNPTGIMLALKPDSFKCDDDEQQFEVMNVLLGLRFATLSQDQDYHCLLNPQLFKQITLTD